mgnify:CR=1 FL=1
MLMPASSEFISLCRSQVALLSQGLGAAAIVVYLTEDLREAGHTKLVPIVAYPETAGEWEKNYSWDVILRNGKRVETNTIAPTTRLLSAAATSQKIEVKSPLAKHPHTETDQLENLLKNSPVQQHQLLLPLIHDGAVMGLLVTAREDRPWNDREKPQLEKIAHTLAIACILDQRSQWAMGKMRQQQQIQAQQHDILDNLLHQFRNPLTALRTFGQLLLKRLTVTDRNRDIASSIVRESDRLKDLLQQLDITIDIQPVNMEAIVDSLDNDNDKENFPNTSLENPLSLHLLPASSLSIDNNLLIESLNVAEILSPLIISAKAIADDRKLHLQAKIPVNLPPVQANAKALGEVLTNLIDNALKYTPPGGKIYIQFRYKQNQEIPILSPDILSPEFNYLGIGISDTGPGIPPQDLEHLFERYYRGVQAQTNIPGTGLGLAIARELVKQMQGEIQVFSPVNSDWLPGNTKQKLIAKTLPGTTFVVWLSLCK